MILGEGHQGLDRLFRVKITHELMRLIDEDDAAASLHETVLHQFGGLVRMLGNKFCRKDFDDCVGRKDSQCVEEPGDDASHGGFAGARGTFEDHVHGGFWEPAALAQFYTASSGDIREAVKMTLDVLEPDERVQFLENRDDTGFVRLGQA